MPCSRVCGRGSAFSGRPQSCLVPPQCWSRWTTRPPIERPKTSGYDTHPWLPSQTLDELPAVRQALAEKRAPREGRKTTSGLSSNARKLLDLAFLYPYTPVARLWKRANIRLRPETQIEVRQELAKNNLAKCEEVRIGSANVALLELLPDGWRLLGQPPAKSVGRGGVAHRHFAQWIRMVGEKRGIAESRLEVVVPGTSHPVDVAWISDGEWHIFEVVAHTPENLLSHINACFGAPKPVASFTIVTAQLAIKKELEKKLRKDLSGMPFVDRIKFEVIEQYMKELF